MQGWSLPPSPQPMKTLLSAWIYTSRVLGFLTFLSVLLNSAACPGMDLD